MAKKSALGLLRKAQAQILAQRAADEKAQAARLARLNRAFQPIIDAYNELAEVEIYMTRAKPMPKVLLRDKWVLVDDGTRLWANGEPLEIYIHYPPLSTDPVLMLKTRDATGKTHEKPVGIEEALQAFIDQIVDFTLD